MSSAAQKADSVKEKPRAVWMVCCTLTNNDRCSVWVKEVWIKKVQKPWTQSVMTIRIQKPLIQIWINEGFRDSPYVFFWKTSPHTVLAPVIHTRNISQVLSSACCFLFSVCVKCYLHGWPRIRINITPLATDGWLEQEVWRDDWWLTDHLWEKYCDSTLYYPRTGLHVLSGYYG